MICKLCGGILQLLGVLANLDHFRCRNCGAEEAHHRHDEALNDLGYRFDEEEDD